MQKIEFGSTGLVIEKNGFGCLPIQRISETEAVSKKLMPPSQALCSSFTASCSLMR